MKAWFSRMLSDGQGVPDEARVAFVAMIGIYLLLWVIWFGTGGWQHWPAAIAPFTGGASALCVAFGITVRTRGSE